MHWKKSFLCAERRVTKVIQVSAERGAKSAREVRRENLARKAREVTTARREKWDQLGRLGPMEKMVAMGWLVGMDCLAFKVKKAAMAWMAKMARTASISTTSPRNVL